MRFALWVILALILCASFVPAQAVQGPDSTPAFPDMPGMPGMPGAAGASQNSSTAPLPLFGPPAPKGGSGPGFNFSIDTGNNGPKKLSTTVEMVLFITLMTMAPAIVLSMTSFTRIIIVLSFMKRAMSVQEMPPAMIVTGLSLFLTLFIMKPVFTTMHEEAVKPYLAEQIDFIEAGERAGNVLGGFMRKQTRETDIRLMYEIAKQDLPASPEDVPFHLLVPAFVLSEVENGLPDGLRALLALPRD